MCDISPLWFIVLILFFLALDLFWHRDNHIIDFKESLLFSLFWIVVALVFNVWIYFCKGYEPSIQYLTAYVVEKSLAVDNLFVFVVIFKYFDIKPRYQHKVLFWGIIGAIVFRALFIGLGLELVERFSWVMYIFAAILIYSGIMMALPQKDYDPEKSLLVRAAKKLFKVTNEGEGRFFYKGAITHMMLALIAVEATDILFALDSIPAVFAITRDPFIVYTSNIFAILGLRSLYFALAGLLTMFTYLHFALSVILIFVGFKILIEPFYKVPVIYSLVFIFSSLAVAIGAGWEKNKTDSKN